MTVGVWKMRGNFLAATSYLVMSFVASGAIAQSANTEGAPKAGAGSTTLSPVIVQSTAPKRNVKRASSPQGATRSAARANPGRQANATPNAGGAAQRGSIPSQTPVPGYVANSASGATKTDTPLMQTPGSISVITHQQMVDQNAQSISDALRYTPGVVAGQRGLNESSLEYLYSRGFQATTFLDGLPIAPPTQVGTGVGFNYMSRDPYFIDRIESIRGPLSVLFGQVPPGGFFNFVSKEPTDTPYHEMFFQSGSYGRAQGGFDFSGPLTEDKQWLYRLTGIGLSTGTQVNGVDQERFGIAPSITWRPDQDTKLTITANYQNDPQAGIFQYVPAVGTVLPGPVKIGPSFNTGNPNFDQFKKEETSIGYSFEHRFDSVWEVKQKVRYSYNDIYIRNASDGAFLTNGNTALDGNSPYINQGTLNSFVMDNQATATFNTGFLRHQVVFGVDYQNYQYNHTFSEGYENGSLPPLSLTNPIYSQSIPTPDFMLGSSGRQSSDQTGLYAQDQIGIGKLTVVGGLREDFSTARFTSYKTGAVTDQTDNAVTGRIGAIYNFDNGIAPYVSYSTSFQPQLGANPAGDLWLPTKGKQTEVGVKYQPVGSKSIFTLAAFDIDQTNVLVSLGGGLSAQVGAVSSKGIEFEARTYLTDNLQAIASYTYNEATNVQRVPVGFGPKVFGIPQNMASLWLTYDMPAYVAPGLKLSGGVRYLDSTLDQTNKIRVPDVTLVDLAAQYDLGQQFASLKGYTVGASVNNLFNKDYIASCLSTAYCVYGQGRMVLANVRYRW